VFGLDHDVACADIDHDCAAKLAFPVMRGWVDSFIGSHLSELIEAQGIPQEEPHLACKFYGSSSMKRYDMLDARGSA
jgi:hypothetical protein